MPLSPQLNHLFQAFAASPYSVAPEREPELTDLVRRLGFQLRPNPNAEDWLFAASSLGQRIIVGTRTLERLWAYCYGYTVIITKLQLADGNNLGALESDPEYKLAYLMLEWADQLNRSDIDLPWPKELPDPRKTEELEHVKAANHIFLMTSGRILLHEIAHLVFSSENTTTKMQSSIEEEFSADAWADSWMLDKWQSYKPDEKVFIGRCLGIACSHAPAFLLGFRPRVKSTTHPTPVSRVVRFIQNHVPDAVPTKKREIDFPISFLFVIMLHVLFKNKYTPAIGDLSRPYYVVFQDFEEYF